MATFTRPPSSTNDGFSGLHTPTKSPAVKRLPVVDETPSPSRGGQHRLLKRLSMSRLLHFTRDLDNSATGPRPYTHTNKSFFSRSFLSHANTSKASIQSEEYTENVQPGSLTKPLLNFKKHLWDHLDCSRKTLHIDLFWPADEEESRGDMKKDERLELFALEDLAPLCNFRNLRSLKIGGMLQSYQKYIWSCCWLNPGLWELTLEMAVEPELEGPQSSQWAYIREGWVSKSESQGSAVYMGEEGQGILNQRLGYGEYLDKQAIAQALKDVPSPNVKMTRLPIVTLTLSGFVVDAGPFRRWFDPQRLRHIHFGRDCVDAGFALPVHMAKNIEVTWPKQKVQKKAVEMSLTGFTRADVNLVKLRKRKVFSPSTSALMVNTLFTTPSKWLPACESPVRDGRVLSRKRAMTFMREADDSVEKLVVEKLPEAKYYEGDFEIF